VRVGLELRKGDITVEREGKGAEVDEKTYL
jgi:hypothetical protein